MTKQVLFGAEINKIQETLFRASMQRQVVGGSRLLVEFGKQATDKAKRYGLVKPLIKGGGGNFRLVFEDETKAKAFGRFLANAYHLALDGNITIADPVSYTDDASFSAANDHIHQQLQQRKQQRDDYYSSPHAPTTAYCDSSGVSLAAHYDSPVPDSNRQYLAATALAKMKVGYRAKGGGDDFLGSISLNLDTAYQDRDWIRRPESAASLDPTRVNNVAYMVADGNNMGDYFAACHTPDQLAALSEALDDAVRSALGSSVSSLLLNKDWRLVEEKEIAKGQEIWIEKVPVMPLIAAGDDIFVLLPAPHALEFARRFCRAFERAFQNGEAKQLIDTLQQQYEKANNTPLPLPTMSAGIVFCKQKYPYLLAHGRGEALLKATKRVVKSVGVKGGGWHSAVSFAFIIGSELLGDEKPKGDYRPTLTTYWASKPAEAKAVAAALPLASLIEAREKLDPPRAPFPKKRLAELRALYAPDRLPSSKDKLEQLREWRKGLDQLHKRMLATDPEGRQWQRLEETLAMLGSANPKAGYWREVERAGESYRAHAILDLLAVWDYMAAL